MMTTVLRRGLPFGLVLLFVAGLAQASAPTRRGEPGYPVDAPASYPSISGKYADQIARQEWAGFLETLERDFFDSRTDVDAQKRALAGFRATKQKFLASLRSEGFAADDMSVAAAETLRTATADSSAEAFADRVKTADDLAKSVTGVFRADRVGGVHSVFGMSVKSYEAGGDTVRFQAMLRFIGRGQADPRNSLIRRLFVRGDENIADADPARVAHLEALLDTCGTTLDASQRAQLYEQMDIADPVFTPERLQELFMLSESIYSVLQDALAPHRAATLKAIRLARQRWDDYTGSVVAHQFPWEMVLNEVAGMTGTIESPPTTQFVLLHPLLAVEIADPEPADAWNPLDELMVKQSMQVNVLGYNWLDARGKYERRWGISGCVSYRSDITTPGYGVSIGWKRWVDVGVVHRRVSNKSTVAVIFSADFWGLIKKEQSGFVRDNAQWLEKVEGFIN